MSLKMLQEKIGVTADGVFGPGTFNAAKSHYSLTDRQAVHFFAQTSHETGEFAKFAENLNYSAEGLSKTFPKYFNTAQLAESYQRKPMLIANRVYGNRMGNGAEATGDGWKYRGRGALQLTGKLNYEAFAQHLNKPEILNSPDLVETVYAFESAMFFFFRNKLWEICDQGLNTDVVRKLTLKINGGLNGLDHRIALTNKYAGYLK